MFWGILPENSFYLGNSLFIMLLCAYIFANKKESFITFVLLGYSINNFLDEILFSNDKLHISELITAIAIPIIWIVKKKLNDRKTKPGTGNL